MEFSQTRLTLTCNQRAAHRSRRNGTFILYMIKSIYINTVLPIQHAKIPAFLVTKYELI